MIKHGIRVTATQIGAITENTVAAELILHSKGRLSPFKPIADDAGIDLLVYDKKNGCGLPLQIKSRTKTVKRHPKTVHFEVRRAVFNEKQDAFLLAVLFGENLTELRLIRAWLIPIKKLPGIAIKRAEKFIIRPSIDLGSNDRYRDYQCENFDEVAQRLITHLAGMKRKRA